MATQQPGCEFSRTVDAEAARAQGLRFSVVASDSERRGVASALDLVSIGNLQAEVTLEPARTGTGSLMSVEWQADVVQSCVVTLEPVATHLEDSFSVLYAPPGTGKHNAGHAAHRETVIDIEDDEPAEPLVNGQIDVGAAIVEHLALALDPYPRSPGAEVPAQYLPDAEERRRESPFAKLAALKSKFPPSSGRR
ncbi:MAG TPA: DUF177 domain-containing protein [Candidatus Cybelea sp.]|nr:DUF177 domain-containing protein [Candidatus Cybelea sp.]